MRNKREKVQLTLFSQNDIDNVDVDVDDDGLITNVVQEMTWQDDLGFVSWGLFYATHYLHQSKVKTCYGFCDQQYSVGILNLALNQIFTRLKSFDIQFPLDVWSGG